MAIPANALTSLEGALGNTCVLSQAHDLKLYEYDGGVDKHIPDVVVFPRSTADVVFILKIARDFNLSFVGRGAGTGLSGGSIPRTGGIVISFARMNKILDLDIVNERALVQPGVVNLDISLAAEPYGYYYAPDPSSQRACTIGGNVAENAGGPHTLAHGVTTNHVVSLEAVLPDGSVLEYGAREPDVPGYDMLGLLTGSEGTLALITKIGVKLLRKPEAVRTMLAVYNTVDEAATTVATLTGRGIVPVAIEMLDGPMLRMVEMATKAGYPMDAAAVLLIEVEGLVEEADEQMWLIKEICYQSGAREVKVADSEEERALLWKGRKNAFGAIGRVSPTYYVQDGVVPRTKVAQTLRFIEALGIKHGLAISNVFHAGDGNLHPIIPFNPRNLGELEKAQKAGDEILGYCLSVGGSITGEHGVGMEKMEMMKHAFPEETLDLIKQIKALFDPQCSLNPGKLLPTGKGCMEIRQKPEFVI